MPCFNIQLETVAGQSPPDLVPALLVANWADGDQ